VGSAQQKSSIANGSKTCRFGIQVNPVKKIPGIFNILGIIIYEIKRIGIRKPAWIELKQVLMNWTR